MKEDKILIYSVQKTMRLKYTLRLLFHDVLKTEYQVCNNFEEFKNSKAAKINYSEIMDETSISMPPSGLLFETGIQEQNLSVEKWKKLPVFFETDKNADFPYDVFAMTFYLVTRYEEYIEPFDVDQYGRFKAEASLAFKNQFLEQPLVNQLALKIKEKIETRFPGIQFEQSSYEYIPTFDVDMAFSCLGKGFWRNAGGFARSILKFEFGKIVERAKVLSGLIPDPFNNFNFIIDALQSNGYKPILFVNLGRYGRYDKNVSFKNLKFFRLLQQLNEKAQLNIHPSYASNSDFELLQDEIAKLEHILGGSVIRSRQHFLILNWPQTYRNLFNLGIVEDYSLGYASRVGFRASICTPFRFYDLLRDEETDLIIHPFAFMDGTLSDYMKLNTEEMLQLIKRISVSVKEVGGNLIGIWHNSVLAEDINLKTVFLKTLSILK